MAFAITTIAALLCAGAMAAFGLCRPGLPESPAGRMPATVVAHNATSVFFFQS